MKMYVVKVREEVGETELTTNIGGLYSTYDDAEKAKLEIMNLVWSSNSTVTCGIYDAMVEEIEVDHYSDWLKGRIRDRITEMEDDIKTLKHLLE